MDLAHHCHTQDTELSFSCCVIKVAEPFLVFWCPRYVCSECLKDLRAEKEISQRATVERRKLESDDMLLLHHWEMETSWSYPCRLSWCTLGMFYGNIWTRFIGCSEWWSREPLDLQLLFSKSILGTCGSMDRQFAPSARDMQSSLHQFWFWHFSGC